jgi:uncharacterized protein with von Willebrand factor type A (vWA) domain
VTIIIVATVSDDRSPFDDFFMVKIVLRRRKKVASGTGHLIRRRYPGDSLKIVLFHDSAEELPLAKTRSLRRLVLIHTNTPRALRLARRILQSQAERDETDRDGD